MTLRAILYLRLSATDDDSTSIVRQEADLRAEAERQGWEVVSVLVDDGISGRKARAKAAQALRMLRDGEAEVLAVWKLDRWTRQGLSAVGDLVRTLEAAPGSVFVALRDGLRSDQAAFGIIAAVLSETAKAEADNAATRTKSAIAYRKASGRFTGGTPPFGYRSVPAPDGPGRVLRIEPAEAEIVRDMADRALAGVPISHVAADLHRRGVPTSRSPYRRALTMGRPTEGLGIGVWESGTVSQMLTSPHLLGRVVHHGSVVTGEDGLPITFWEPVLDLGTFARLQDAVHNPRQPRKARTGRTRAALLLSGVAFCAECGSKLYVHYNGRKLMPSYQCPKPKGILCQSKPTMTAHSAERAVVEAYLSVVGAYPEETEVALVEDDGRGAELVEIEAALKETTLALTADDANVTALLGRLELLKAKRAELKAAPVTATSYRAVRTGRTYAEAWDAAETIEERRRLLLRVMDHVTIAGTTARSGYHPERVSIKWYEPIELREDAEERRAS